MRAVILTPLALLLATQPAWACKNAMGPTGANAGVFWGWVGVFAAMAFFTGLYLYSRYKGSK
tara:strand:+ start:2101 stop:2286 length:186 start_codon:yes stop_codon:yes gene_type:complete